MKTEINYADYGYKDEDTVVISGKLFNQVTIFLETLGREKGFEVGYPMKETLEETLSPDNKAVELLSPLGLNCMMLSQLLDQAHIDNTNAGNSSHKDELIKTTKIGLA